MHPRQLADVYISCVNNDLLKHWLDLKSNSLLDILKQLRKLS